jgi:hypothetical protein
MCDFLANAGKKAAVIRGSGEILVANDLSRENSAVEVNQHRSDVAERTVFVGRALAI